MTGIARHCRGTEEYIIQPYTWQSYGVYTEGEAAGLLFAGAVRASNEYMARDAALAQAQPYGPVITAIRPIEPMVRPIAQRRQWRRDNARWASC